LQLPQPVKAARARVHAASQRKFQERSVVAKTFRAVLGVVNRVLIVSSTVPGPFDI
jgi:hypothetical protein